MIFYVDDTGIGVPEEFKSVIFDKFRQLDESAKRKYGGTGLGLYYARKIAEMMGGNIWLESKTGWRINLLFLCTYYAKNNRK